MEPKDYSNTFNRARQEIRYARALGRKRQIINTHLEELHTMYIDMIESAVQIKESEGFPEATQVINYIRSL
jgi:hypothetical protein